jgi:hypothetical protein
MPMMGSRLIRARWSAVRRPGGHDPPQPGGIVHEDAALQFVHLGPRVTCMRGHDVADPEPLCRQRGLVASSPQ